eukprot:TRINITY_DN18792_c0_g1_i4.p2 TRINITY_DN18792_c0_g1~~TRINITY_DN18792_c0_g1_i4.p2  ORF type:complete len:157 (+),score=28.54 TRINITY_DN18792_c0_g1_i4:44-472(+)
MSKGGGLHQALKAMQKNAGVVRTGKKGTAEGGIDHAELRKIAEKAATFAALYGDRFEQLVQANHKRDSRFAFIARTHELHPFYQAQVNAALAEQYAQAGRGEKVLIIFRDYSWNSYRYRTPVQLLMTFSMPLRSSCDHRQIN